MAEQLPDMKSALKKWAYYTQKDWKTAIQELRIGKTKEFYNSFRFDVSGDSIQTVKFNFLYYGKFSDMGVGRGIKLDSVRNKKTLRKKKPWFNKKFYYNTQSLAEIMASIYAVIPAVNLKETIEFKS